MINGEEELTQMARDAHDYCTYHRKQLMHDKVCGCFYCLTIFNPIEIEEWWDKEQTATCPYCGIDSVIGESSGYPITREFLRKMKEIWF